MYSASIASIASFTGEAKRPAHSATKVGINALARHVASRWGKEGIRANAVVPGLIMTAEIEQGAAPDLLMDQRTGRQRRQRHRQALTLSRSVGSPARGRR
ncbi:SDR family oxidoreductase [Streptomyces sp. NPDC000618]|uniref:SDR family oxidoreductase n=1 Tax=Streptomyces sp. NPDC000618 TaxID=3154265 RepID=UPI003322CCF1